MLHLHIAGTLATDPAEGTTRNGDTFLYASVRTTVEGGEALFISAAAFDEKVRELLATLRKGDAVSLSGRGKLKHWTTQNGSQRSGLDMAIQQIMLGKPEPRRYKRKAGAVRCGRQARDYGDS